MKLSPLFKPYFVDFTVSVTSMQIHSSSYNNTFLICVLTTKSIKIFGAHSMISNKIFGTPSSRDRGKILHVLLNMTKMTQFLLPNFLTAVAMVMDIASVPPIGPQLPS